MERAVANSEKHFLLFVRIFFVLFSLIFMKDAFYRWDGYSYYMRFQDFLPDLSLAFVLWTIIGAIVSILLWAGIYIIFRAVAIFFAGVRLAHLLALFIFTATLLFIKDAFLTGVSISGILGVDRFLLIAVLVVALLFLSWAMRQHADKFVSWMLNGFDSRLKPLFYLFLVLFVLSIPLSFLSAKTPGGINGLEVSTVNKSAIAKSQEEVSRLPNIILVVIDTLTALDMSLYGYERPTTPFISKWSLDASVFNRMYASSNWTSPTVMSIMTGQRPWTHGVWYMTSRHSSRDYIYNLPRVLKENGYDNYAFIQNRYAHPDTLGISSSFLKKESYHTFELGSGWWFDYLAGLFVSRNLVKEWIFEDNTFAEIINSFKPGLNHTLVPPRRVYDDFLKYMTEVKKDAGVSEHKPFFAWLQVYPPHDPYIAPAPYFGMFGDADMFVTDKEQLESGMLEGSYNVNMQADIDILRKRYDEFIRYGDTEFERFINGLSGIVDMSNTVIILTGDHGESFAHGYQGHSGPHLFESLIHVPFIIKLPESEGPEVIDIPVEQIDISPTILDMLGIPLPAWMDGRSLMPLLKGDQLKPQPLFTMQFIENKTFGQQITKGTLAVVDGDYKLIHYLEDNRSFLFNVRLDPGETQNLLDKEQERAGFLLEQIRYELSAVNARITRKHKNALH